MKTIKPHEEKFFKDIVLNDILKEISDENSDTSDPVNFYKQRTTPSSKNKMIKIGLSVFLLASLLMFYNLYKTPENTPEQSKPAVPRKTITKIADPALSNIKLRPEDDKPIQNIQEKAAIKIVEKKTEKVVPVQKIEKTEREVAKALLLQQMQN